MVAWLACPVLPMRGGYHGSMHKSQRFFFSSRRRHTRLVSDWSSDVCSSDLGEFVVPPLRERRDDLPALAAHFLDLTRREGATRARSFSEEALRLLVSHDYPGNVRELRNLVERLALRAAGETITDTDMRAVLPASAPPSLSPAAASVPVAGRSDGTGAA